ncbi:YtxH domain-containing protein [Microbacterium terrisoli]|uniref:YtxH domain-containing protein n=1 Tax=Microbacterium terrisoli TaxID=3242192 RepID=UPI0028043385|nr:YtxH domain-containing protein [Microbacterium protaetiae]
MRGKVGLAIGLAVGYVLGTRAGRERYEQIKEQAEKLWNLEPVQDQVDKVKDLGKSAAMAVPSMLWDGAVKVAKAASSRGTAGERLDAAVDAGRESADDVAAAAKVIADDARRAARNRDRD